MVIIVTIKLFLSLLRSVMIVSGVVLSRFSPRGAYRLERISTSSARLAQLDSVVPNFQSFG